MCAVLLMGFSYTAKAQVSIQINLNHQPAWGPSGYDRADFYYFPDLNIYYDVNNSLFYYFSGSRWISNHYLPSRYDKYDFYQLHKVVMNNGPRPWLRNRNHKKEYMKFRGDRNQTPIKSSNDSRYNQSRKNSRMWVRDGKQRANQEQKNNHKVDKQRNQQHNNRRSNNKHSNNR